MGNDAGASVVDKFGRTHDIANLFICDGSSLLTQGSANPGLTIQALAARTTDYLISQNELCSGPSSVIWTLRLSGVIYLRRQPGAMVYRVSEKTLK